MTPKEDRVQDLQLLQSLLDYQFTDIELLNTALTHKSFAFEHEKDVKRCERLGFLGDATINLITDL